MKEASPVKFYFAKYFFLVFGLLQWLCGMLLFLQLDVDKSKWAGSIFFTIGLISIILYFLVASRLRRVSLGKNRITVTSDGKSFHYDWPDVKWIRPVPFIHVYKLKLRGIKGRIYFLPERQEVPLYGLFQKGPELTDTLRRRAK